MAVKKVHSRSRVATVSASLRWSPARARSTPMLGTLPGLCPNSSAHASSVPPSVVLRWFRIGAISRSDGLSPSLDFGAPVSPRFRRMRLIAGDFKYLATYLGTIKAEVEVMVSHPPRATRGG